MGSHNARLKRKACIGKRQYQTHDQARAAAQGSSRTFNQRLGFYKCQFANHYHVGHTPAKVIKAMRQRPA